MIPVLVCLAALARAASAEICSPAGCVSGTTNIALGASFSSAVLLPGTYASTSPAAGLLDGPVSASEGITTSDTRSFPFTVSLASVIAFGSTNYAGESTLVGLGSNLSSPRLPTSLAVPSNMAVTFRSSSSPSSLVLFSSVPDTAQLSLVPDLAISSVQSTSCSPACASGGACTANGTCACAQGFSGTQCEQCAPGFFGSSCQKCQDSCCDDGMTGSGKCLGAKTKTPTETCGCQNGICTSDGGCACNPGWANPTSGQNATLKCSICATGFFQDASGECQVCSQGCTACAAPSGVCTSCQANFTPDSNDRTRCALVTNSTTTCPDGQFLDPATSTCAACSPLCKTCTGPLSTQCIACGAGQFMVPGGRCVAVDSSGVCQGTKFVANNAKGICDACPSTCTSCSIPSFSVVSTPAQITCSACLPGHVLTPNKRCAVTCPAGTFVSPQDGVTCTPCDSSCAECTGSATFCTACAGGRGTIDGKCVASCPSGSVLAPSASTNSTGTTCVSCHPDCLSCSGPGMAQCSTCPPSRPLKSSDGRCLPASSCGQGSFFDVPSGACRTCDTGCAGCSGAGAGTCTACAAGQVLRSGQCVDSGCGDRTYLGVCLADLATAINSRSTTTRPVGLTPLQGALVGTSSLGLVVLGLLFWRRQARKKRAARTAVFADNLPEDPNAPSRWEWGKVWRMRREEGWFAGLKLVVRGVRGLRPQKSRSFHREMSLRKLGGRGRNSDETQDPRWANLRSRPSYKDEQETFVFERPVVVGPVPGSARTWYRDSNGAYGRINPESHFARTLARTSEEHEEVPVEANMTGASAHTFGVAPSLAPSSKGLASQSTGSVAAHPTGSDIRAGSWMLPNHTGLESVSTHATGSVAPAPKPAPAPIMVVPQHTGLSSVPSHYTGNSSVIFHHTGSSGSSFAPQPRQPIRDSSNNINPFGRTVTLTGSHTNTMMSPPPQGVPSSPVWPGAIGGSYWLGGSEQPQSRVVMGDKNPFRRI